MNFSEIPKLGSVILAVLPMNKSDHFRQNNDMSQTEIKSEITAKIKNKFNQTWAKIYYNLFISNNFYSSSQP